MSGRRFHHDPGSDVLQAPGAQRFEPPYFGLDIVCLDIQVHPTGMIDSLHFDVQLVWARIELAVLLVFRFGQR